MTNLEFEKRLEAFEAWALSKGGLTWGGSGRSGNQVEYFSDDWNRAWEVWQAAQDAIADAESEAA